MREGVRCGILSKLGYWDYRIRWDFREYFVYLVRFIVGNVVVLGGEVFY